MNNTVESIQKDIANDFALADLLSDLVEANVQAVADEVMSGLPGGQQHFIDSAKVGSYEVWVNRLTGMLRDSERDF